MTDVDVVIARTEPAYAGRPEVREVEALYLDSIAAAQRHIYIESQYFTSRRIAAALGDRLQESAWARGDHYRTGAVLRLA